MLLRAIDHDNIVKCINIYEDCMYYYLVRPTLRLLPFYSQRREGPGVAWHAVAQGYQESILAARFGV
jgi:hypothetical protein